MTLRWAAALLSCLGLVALAGVRRQRGRRRCRPPRCRRFLLPAAVRRRADRRRPREGHQAHQARRGAARHRADRQGGRARWPPLTWWSTCRVSSPPSTRRSHSQAKGRGFDVTASAHLDLAAAPDPHEGRARASTRHARARATRTSGSTRSGMPPWPSAIAAHLSSIDPAHAADYQTRATAFTARLSTLDAEFAAGLAHCRSRDLVTSHTAFGYLAEALRPAPGRASPGSPPSRSRARGTGQDRRDCQGPRGEHDLRRDPGQPRRSPTPSPARPARGVASPRPAGGPDRRRPPAPTTSLSCAPTSRRCAPARGAREHGGSTRAAPYPRHLAALGRPSATPSGRRVRRHPGRAAGRGRGAARPQRLGQVHAGARACSA